MTVEDITNNSLRRWLEGRQRVVAATLVEVIGSAPLNPGAVMLVDSVGQIEGSVTGGCVEGALVEEARRVFAGGPPRILTFGISDDLAGDVGLMCGGTVRILVAEIAGVAADVWRDALAAIADGRPVAVATVLSGPLAGDVVAVIDRKTVGALSIELLEHSVEKDLAGALEQGTSLLRRYGSDGTVTAQGLEVFIRVFTRPPRMIIIGAIDFSAEVARLASQLGYAVTICDARQAFLRSQRFSAFAEVVQQWPDEYLRTQTLERHDAVLVFSHDAKFDEPALTAALASEVGFVGAMGSRTTHADRTRRLREARVSEPDLARIASPVGLDIGACTPAETAVSVLAEIIAARTGRNGGHLSQTSGSIRVEAGQAASGTPKDSSSPITTTPEVSPACRT